MKLHLGCGQVYLEGYVNIDYPLDKHSVQTTTVADKFADLTKLKYKPGSIEEVRLHHVFEHFRRPVALALLSSWHSWLKDGGRVHIEVPDFEATARRAISPIISDRKRKVAFRHIFGSNEADWAVHYDGWSKRRFAEIFNLMGFEVTKTTKSAYSGTYNITTIGTKNRKTLAKKELDRLARQYLGSFTVNDSDSEKRLLDIWVGEFNQQLSQTFAGR